MNTLQELRNTPFEYGCEIDIRTEAGELILHHDSFASGELLSDWLKAYRHSGLILNVKEAGLENAIEDLMRFHAIEDYFFLDQAFPYILWGSQKGNMKAALRYSEFESMSSLRLAQGIAEWVWVDSFHPFSHTSEQLDEISAMGFKICIVAPELQKRTNQAEISAIQKVLMETRVPVDAVCTKLPQVWTSTNR